MSLSRIRMCKITCITNNTKNIQNRAMMCLFACTPKGFIVIYVDKTGLLEYTNSVLNSTNAYICNSRPRKLGKSITANMLTAYYSKASDSSEMFSNLKISKNQISWSIWTSTTWFILMCNGVWWRQETQIILFLIVKAIINEQ